MAKKDKVNLNAQVSDDLLESAAGGYVHNAGNTAGDYSKPWEAIWDNDGEIIGRYATKEEAMYAAGANHVSGQEIGKPELDALRNSYY